MSHSCLRTIALREKERPVPRTGRKTRADPAHAGSICRAGAESAARFVRTSDARVVHVYGCDPTARDPTTAR